MQKVYTADFASLRAAYNEVKAFLEVNSWEKVTSLSTTVENDLGLAGDDNLAMLEKFVDTYNLDYTGFNYSRHFLSEGELFNSRAFYMTMLIFPLWLLDKITLSKFGLYRAEWVSSCYRPTTDLTFGDMLTWYLTKSFNTRADITVKLQE